MRKALILLVGFVCFGLLLLILAWLSGAQFLATQQNNSSLTMSLAFMGALIAYLLGYSLSNTRSQKQSI